MMTRCPELRRVLVCIATVKDAHIVDEEYVAGAQKQPAGYFATRDNALQCANGPGLLHIESIEVDLIVEISEPSSIVSFGKNWCVRQVGVPGVELSGRVERHRSREILDLCWITRPEPLDQGHGANESDGAPTPSRSETKEGNRFRRINPEGMIRMARQIIPAAPRGVHVAPIFLSGLVRIDHIAKI